MAIDSTQLSASESSLHPPSSCAVDKLGGEKRTAEDSMWLKWLEQAPAIYDEIYYRSNPLVAYVNSYGHIAAEIPFPSSRHFSRVLEVGGGTGEHLQYVEHSFDEYLVTDIDQSLLEQAQGKPEEREGVKFERQNALALTYDDSSFDRLVSIYNLEHLPTPHLALKEWKRVVRAGGTISVSIPTEGGVAWNLGRYLTTRRSFKKKGLDLDYIIAREHINACYRLRSLISYYFEDRRENWFPLKIHSTHCNLVYTATLVNSK